MLCGELVIFLALAFVKDPWMMTRDCGWAFFFFFFFKEQIDDEFEYWKKKKMHQMIGMRPINSMKNIK